MQIHKEHIWKIHVIHCSLSSHSWLWSYSPCSC